MTSSVAVSSVTRYRSFSSIIRRLSSQREIDSSDYYVLIIGGKYGSLAPDGISYTEKEYDYALEREKPIYSFLYENLDNLKGAQLEQDPANREKLARFRKKASATKLVKTYTNPDELKALVWQALSHAFTMRPQEGWVRANKTADPELANEVVRLSQENRELRDKGTHISAYSSFYYGNKREPRPESVFQDFQINRSNENENANAVQYLWADTARGSEIQAQVFPQESLLRVRVKTGGPSYPCNIAIRGKCESAMLKQKRYLVFAAKLVEGATQKRSPVCVAVRLINGLLQHWFYRRGVSSYMCTPISRDSCWTIVKIDLDNPERWRRFESDGNPDGPQKASFDCICSVVLELGREGIDRPDGTGSAAIDIGPFMVVSDEREYRDYLLTLNGPLSTMPVEPQ